MRHECARHSSIKRTASSWLKESRCLTASRSTGNLPVPNGDCCGAGEGCGPMGVDDSISVALGGIGVDGVIRHAAAHRPT